MEEIRKLINQFKNLDCKAMYNNDFLLTWEKTDDEIHAYSGLRKYSVK